MGPWPQTSWVRDHLRRRKRAHLRDHQARRSRVGMDESVCPPGTLRRRYGAIYCAYRYLPDHPAFIDPRPRPGQVQQDQSPQWTDLIRNFYEAAGIGAFRVRRRSLEHDAAKNHADTERANRHRSNDERRITDYTLGSKRVPILGTRRRDG